MILGILLILYLLGIAGAYAALTSIMDDDTLAETWARATAAALWPIVMIWAIVSVVRGG